MKKSFILFTSLFVVPIAANAAGTYYNGDYQSPQYKYTQSSTQPANYQKTTSKTNQWPYPSVSNNYQPKYNSTSKTNSENKKFSLSAGISRETANWEMEMNQSGSILHYDNISWNVFDAGATYDFGTVKLDAGIKYGMQSGEAHMTDDDLTNGGYYIDTFYWDDDADPLTPDVVLGDIYGKSISIGTSESGSMFGFNLGLNLMEKFNIGKAKFTPSIGYRHFSYSLETNKNNGLSLQSGYCVVLPGSDETQCSPLVMIDEDGDGIIDSVLWDDNIAPSGQIYLGDTFGYSQPGTSHKYDVSWSGPYAAVDMNYEINPDTALTARLELGLPSYTSTGDQPYRPDWAHPKSIEDSAGIGDAWHVGFSANWFTAITDRVKLSMGFTYDYYNVSGADAETFLNEDYYTTLYWNQINDVYAGDEAAAIAANDGTVMGIINLQEQCPNWICKQSGEIDSFYKSMGIRIGLSSEF